MTADVPSAIPHSAPNTNMARQRAGAAFVPVLAVFLGLLVGAMLILVQGRNPGTAVTAVFHGSFDGWKAFGRTLEKATPLILTGTAIIVGLRAGLFNIGAQGQLVAGAVFAAWAGFRFQGLSPIVHVPLALAIGGLAGAVPAALSGLMKAKRGVHEVISTIMLNSVIIAFADWLASRPWRSKTAAFSKTATIQPSAVIGRIQQLPLGVFLAIGAALLVALLLNRTTFGFRLSAIGGNRNAASYAGIAVGKATITAMALSGLLAGLGGAIETLGVLGHYEQNTSSTLGFDGITIALLAKLNPKSTIPAAILIGAMRAADTKLQSEARIEPEIVSVIVAVILLFVAAPALLRWITKRLGIDEGSGLRLTSGWGS